MTTPTGEGPRQDVLQGDRLGRRVAGALTALYVVLIIVVALVPSKVDLSMQNVTHQIARARAPSTRHWNLHAVRDAATNVLLFLPLGLLAALALPPSHRPGVLLGPLLSLAVELCQLGTVDRYADVLDLTTNSSGYLLGYGAMRLALRAGLRPGFLVGVGSGDKATVARAIQSVYVVVLVVASLTPLDVTVSLREIGLKASGHHPSGGRISLDPIEPFRRPHSDIGAWVNPVATFVPLGLLGWLAGGRATPVSRALRYGLLVSVAIETAKVFVRSRSSGLFDILSALLGTMLGASVAPQLDSLLAGPSRRDGPDRERVALKRRAVLFLGGYLMLLVAHETWPYRFESSPRAALRKLERRALIPFFFHVETRRVADWDDVVEEIGLFVPLGVLTVAVLTAAGRSLTTSAALTSSGLLGVVCAWPLELSQLAAIGRTFDVTDVLCHCIGALFGGVLARSWGRLAGEASSEAGP